MRIGLNIHGQNVPDRDELLRFLMDTRPAWVLIMDNLELAKDVQSLLPGTNVIYRNWGADGDDNDALQYSPEAWVNERKAMAGNSGLWMYTTNEPAFDAHTIDWHVRVLELAQKAGLKVVVGNWAVGNPKDVDNAWGMADKLLRLLDAYRDTAVMGLHEYACGVITSGLIGGTPEDRGLIMPDTWPEDAKKLTKWHCGRFEFLVKYCEKVGIKPPRIVISEHGFDDLADMKAWTETLQKTPVEGNPGGNIRGWRTLATQWQDWFKEPAEEAYFRQLRWADEHIYQGTVVEGQLIYCWGHSSDTWIQFDVAEAKTLHNRLVDYAGNDTPPPDPLPANGEGEEETPPPTEQYPAAPGVDDPRWSYRLAKPAGAFRVFLRENPTENSKSLGQVGAADIVAVIGDLSLNYGEWRPVRFKEAVGWMHTAYVRFVMGEEDVPPITPPPADEDAPVVYQITEGQLSEIVAALDRLTAALRVVASMPSDNGNG